MRNHKNSNHELVSPHYGGFASKNEEVSIDILKNHVQTYSVPTPVPERQLIEQIKRGNQDAFAELMKRYENAVFLYTLRMLQYNTEDAQDVASETWTSAYFNIHSFNQKRKFITWIYRIAHNKAVDLIRKKSKVYIADIDNFEEKLSVISQVENPNSIDLHSILSKLKPSDRHILTLHYLEEKTIQEISHILSILPGLVSLKLFRAKKRAQSVYKTLNLTTNPL
jgi:RNA polymerase sigma-70 factor, ECF subfamily